MKLPVEHFKPYIPTVVGQQININHDDCPAGRDTRSRLYVKRTQDAVLAYCHNCNGHRVIRTSKRVRPLALLRKIVQESESTIVQPEVHLPPDAESDPDKWPVAAQAWIYQYNIIARDIRILGICYSESWGRVILPVHSGGKLIFWQGRKIEGSGPKYISVSCGHKPLFFQPCPRGTCNTVVVVEDYLSAVRVSHATSCDAVALLGTTGPDDLAEQLSGYHHIIVWLDPDHAGRSKSKVLADRLKLTSRARVYNITGPNKQPKECSDGEINLTVASVT